MMEREFRDYLQDLYGSAVEVLSFIESMNYEQFVKDKKTLNAVIRSLEVMGEAVKNLPQEIKAEHPDIDWKGIAGLRDRLIHAYFGIDPEIIWEICRGDLPNLKPKIEELLKKYVK